MFDVDLDLFSDDANFRRAPTDLYMEFNHLYRWHNTVPDELNYNPPIPFYDVFFNPQGFLNFTLQDHLDAFYSTPAGAFVPRNIPWFLREPTVKTIKQGRAVGLQSFTAYQERHGFPRYTSFDQLSKDPSIIAALQSLYASIDDVDLYVGLNIEQLGVGVLPHLIFFMVAEHAFFYLLNFPLYRRPDLISSGFLTSEGLAYFKNSTARGLISQHLQVPSRDKNLFTTSMESLLPAELCDMYHTELHNIFDFVGQDFLWDYFIGSDRFHQLFLTLLFMMAGFVVVYSGPMKLAHHHPVFKHKTASLITFNAMSFAVYAIQAPVYTYLAVIFLFSCRFDQVADSSFIPIGILYTAHGVMYLVEAVIRSLVSYNRLLVLHHVAWFMLVGVTFWTKSIFSSKLTVILDLFSTYEFGLFVLLFWSKVYDRRLLTVHKVLGQIGVWIFTVSRFLQFVLLVYFFVGSYEKMKSGSHLGLYFFELGLVAFLFCAQTYTVFFYLRWRSLWQMGKDEPSCPSPKADADGASSTPRSPTHGGNVTATTSLGCDLSTVVQLYSTMDSSSRSEDERKSFEVDSNAPSAL